MRPIGGPLSRPWRTDVHDRRVAARLAARGLVVVRSARLSGSGAAPVYVAQLVDGRRVKVRLVATASGARRIWRLLQIDRGGVLARPICCLGRAIVTDFVAGESLLARLRSRRRSEPQ